MDSNDKKRVLAVASGGGHWIQLRRLMPAFDDHDIAFVTTMESYRDHVAAHRFYAVNDANIRSKWALIKLGLRLVYIVLKERPDIVISTGAAPGYLSLRIGKWLGASTIWVDSIANAEKLSLSGQRIGPHADLWLTQWAHLAEPDGPHFAGGVM